MCRTLKRFCQSDRVPTVLEGHMGEPVWTAALRASASTALWTHYLKSSPLSLLCFCTVAGNLDWQFPPASLSSICLFTHFSFFSIIFLFWTFLQGLLRGPERPKSLFITVTTRSKAVHSAAMPLGPVAFLRLVSCPVPFRGWWKDTIHKKTKTKQKQQQGVLFLERDVYGFIVLLRSENVGYVGNYNEIPGSYFEATTKPCDLH